MTRATALLAFWALSAAAQIAPGSLDGPSVMLRGRVVDARTGTAVKGARVAVEVDGRTPADSAYADHDGRFVLRKAPPGNHGIVSVKSGYEDYSRGIRIAEDEDGDLVLRMDRYAAIAGRVVDDEGEPVAGAIVTALRRRYVEGVARYVPMGRGRDGLGRGSTDDRGDYRVWDLPFGNYVVAVRPETEPSPQNVIRLAHMGVFYPGVTRMDEATPLSLRWGQRLEGVDLVLAASPETRVVGIVTASDGKACEDCFGFLKSMDDLASDAIASMRPNDGEALVLEGLPPGRYSMALREYDRSTSSSRYGVGLFDVVEGKTGEFALNLNGEQPVSGRVVLESPPEADTSSSEEGASTPRISIYGDPWDALSTPRSRGGFKRLRAAGLGPYEFELSVPAGRAKVRVSMSARDAYLRTVRLNGRELDEGRLEVPVGGLKNLECVMAFDVGTVTGSVLAGEELDDEGPLLPQRQVVRLIPASGWDGFQLGGRIEPDGSFTVRGAPPGRYVAYALPARPYYAPDDPKIQPRLKAYGKPVEVRAGQATEVTLTAAPRLDALP